MAMGTATVRVTAVVEARLGAVADLEDALRQARALRPDDMVQPRPGVEIIDWGLEVLQAGKEWSFDD